MNDAASQVDVGPVEVDEFAAPQPVEGFEFDGAAPPVLAGDGEEPVELGAIPGVDRLGRGPAGDDTRRGHRRGRFATKLARLDGIGEHRPQSHADDLDAAPTEGPASGQSLEPRRDVVAIEAGRAGRAEAVPDVARCPAVLFACRR